MSPKFKHGLQIVGKFLFANDKCVAVGCVMTNQRKKSERTERDKVHFHWSNSLKGFFF